MRTCSLAVCQVPYASQDLLGQPRALEEAADGTAQRSAQHARQHCFSRRGVEARLLRSGLLTVGRTIELYMHRVMAAVCVCVHGHSLPVCRRCAGPSAAEATHTTASGPVTRPSMS